MKSKIQELSDKLWVNDKLCQNFITRDYIHHEYEIISYLSQFFTLYPGDIISMGSAPGSARSWNNKYLKPKDTIRFNITGLGEQFVTIIKEPLDQQL